MKNKEIIQVILPGTKIESHTTGFLRERYYLSEGETDAKAWKNALPVVLERAKDAIKEIKNTHENKEQ